MKEAHIKLENINIKYALLPGDPARLDRIKLFLDKPTDLAYNREFRSLKGFYKGVEILALSTGIGGSSCSIAIEEAHHLGVELMIRIGSCGALQPNLELGELIVVEAAIRDDGASLAYAPKEYPAYADSNLLALACEKAKILGFKHCQGIIHSHESFYIDNNEEITNYYSKLGALGSDMETATLYTVSRLRKVKALSILNNVVCKNDDTALSIGEYSSGASLTARGEENEIKLALETIYAYHLSQKNLKNKTNQ